MQVEISGKEVMVVGVPPGDFVVIYVGDCANPEKGTNWPGIRKRSAVKIDLPTVMRCLNLNRPNRISNIRLVRKCSGSTLFRELKSRIPNGAIECREGETDSFHQLQMGDLVRHL